jgi:3'-5' exoribonuclease
LFLRESFRHVPRTAINQLVEHQNVDQAFQAADKQLRVNRQGGKYLLLKLADRSGTIVAMVWNADERLFEAFDRGDFIACKGRTQVHNGNLQMIVTELQRMDPKEVNLADFDRFDASEADRLTIRLRELIEERKNEHLRSMGLAFIDDASFMARFRVAAAAVTNHHAYPGGLLRHTVELMELATLIGPRYPQMDTDLLVLGAFLHDIGKVEELSSGGEVTYTDRGQLVGHLIIGVQMLGEKVAELNTTAPAPFPIELRQHLEHMILSHHGQLEFGSPKIPLTLEALALHHLDNLDAKIAAATSVIENDVSADGNWTNYNPGMGRKLWKPKPS